MATKTTGASQRFIARVLCLTPMLAAIGCGAGFDSPDWVKSLRVLGVRKDKPYAPPTTDPTNPTDVHLTMLDYDGTHSSTAPQRLWFSGCDDLPGDQYFTCLAYMHKLWQLYILAHPGYPAPASQLQEGTSWSPGDPGALSDDEVVKVGTEIANIATGESLQVPADQARAFLLKFHIGAGERFTYNVPLGIVEGHRASSDPNIPQYGLSFIFFTDCIGHIDTAPNWQNVDIAAALQNAVLGFPFVCLDDESNTALGPDDFVSGYTQVFVPSDGTVNNNPTFNVVSGVSFNGKPLDPDTDGVQPGAISGADADAGTDAGAAQSPGAKAFCIDEDCVPLPALDPCDVVPKSRHVPRCSGKCANYEFGPTMVASANNDPGVFNTQIARKVGEQMWVDYYTDRGTLKHEVRLVRDGSADWSEDGIAGWDTDFSNQWTPPADAGPVNLWAVAHDTRGGTGWVRLQICVD